MEPAGLGPGSERDQRLAERQSAKRYGFANSLTHINRASSYSSQRLLPRRKRTHELNKTVAKFKRGESVPVKQVDTGVGKPGVGCGPLHCCPIRLLRGLMLCVLLQISDKKLKGKMQHTERLNSEAAVAAAKTDEWLLPAEAGTLEAEGMERTWRFSQVAKRCVRIMLPSTLELLLFHCRPCTLVSTSRLHLRRCTHMGHCHMSPVRSAQSSCMGLDHDVRETTAELSLLRLLFRP